MYILHFKLFVLHVLLLYIYNIQYKEVNNKVRLIRLMF